ncbi:MAG: RNA methyltransferase [Spirochaetales bacterium]|nr:RNA methyltransferase [Spirochaetales bacterium]
MDGAQQAASTGLPEVEFYRDLDEFLKKIFDQNNNVKRIVLDNIEPDVKLSQYNPGDSNCLIAIGSERGWSDREREIFRKHQFVFAGLGRRVLRTETACTAGITLLLVRMGLI